MKRRALILGYVWPETESSAAGMRDQNILDALRSMGMEVHYASHAKPNRFQEAIEAQGVATRQILLNHTSFDEWAKELAPDLVIFDRFVTEEQYGARVFGACPNALRVLDTQDLHSLRRAREKMLRKNADAGEILACDPYKEMRSDFLRELAAIHRSDLSLIISDFEQALLLERYSLPEQQLLYFPFCYGDAPADAPAWGERSGFVFLGNFRHPPNYDSIFWTVNEIWPELRKKIPAAELHVYGAYPPKEVMALHAPEKGIFLHGPVVDHLAALAKYRVNLAPLRFGAGIKGKISDAWFSGTPTVSTAIGAEGMQQGEDGWGGTICASIAEIVSAAHALHENQSEWELARQRGQRILQEKFCRRQRFSEFSARINTALENTPGLREKNLTGALLLQDTQRSGEYFSRWIELKEKIECSAKANS